MHQAAGGPIEAEGGPGAREVKLPGAAFRAIVAPGAGFLAAPDRPPATLACRRTHRRQGAGASGAEPIAGPSAMNAALGKENGDNIREQPWKGKTVVESPVCQCPAL